MLKKIAIVMIMLFPIAGCSGAQQKGSVGTVIGGIAGAIIGHQSGERDKGIVLGAVTGGALGYMIGNEQDKSDLRAGQRDRGTDEYPDRTYQPPRERKVWVEGWTERVWVNPEYSIRYDRNGCRERVKVRDGHYTYIEHPGYWRIIRN